jgi:hypothetical protein
VTGAVALLALLTGAEWLVPAGASLADAMARAATGDTVRLGPGEHRGALGRLAGVTVAGAGAGVTVVLAPPGEDGAVTDGDATLRDLSLVAGPARTGLKALSGAVTLERVALVGGSTGLFVDGARVEGRETWLEGGYGLLQGAGVVRLTGLIAHGGRAGLALLTGDLEVTRGAVTGPSAEAAVTIAGGTARLAELVLRNGGPSGLSVSGGVVTARDLSIAGPRESGGIGGDCLLVMRARVTLRASELTGCGGAAIEASHAELHVEGVDAEGGSAGGFIFTDQTRVELLATLVTGRGPGLVAMQGSRVRGWQARHFTDPSLWIDCGSGARVEWLDAHGARQPCEPEPSRPLPQGRSH